MAGKNRNNFCGSPAHSVSRRSFLGGTLAGAAAITADMTQLDLFKQAESIETSSRVYEFGSISGAGDELRSVFAAIGKLSGPEIKVGQTENELTVKATGAQHAVIAAVIDAMKAAANQDPH